MHGVQNLYVTQLLYTQRGARGGGVSVWKPHFATVAVLQERPTKVGVSGCHVVASICRGGRKWSGRGDLEKGGDDVCTVGG